MNTVTVAAGTIEYRDEGYPTGPPVVLLHGVFMKDSQWNLSLPLLPKGFHYLLPVLPIGGRTDRPDYDYLDGLTVRVYPGAADGAGVTVTTPEGRSARFTVADGDVRADVPWQADWVVEKV